MTIGKKIYTLRTKSGMTQEQLAEKMGVSRQAISKWESGMSIPELSKLKTLANLYQVTLDELMDEKPLEENVVDVEEKNKNLENDDKAYKSLKITNLIQSAAMVMLGAAVIVLSFNLKSIKDDIWGLQSEIARLSSMITYTPSEPEESVFQEYDFELGEINPETKTFTFSFTCIPKEFTETTKITLVMESTDGEVYNMELQGGNGIFRGEMEMPICAIDKTLFIVEDQGEKIVNVEYSMFDMIREVYPGFCIKVPTKNEIEEIEVSLTGKEYEVLKDNEKRVENITLQIHGGWAGKETKLLWETTLTKEEVEQIVYGEVLKVPVEIKEEEPEYVYVKVLFEHELLEGQQLMEAEAVPMDKGRVYTYAVLNLYYEYATVAWQQW